MKYVTSAPIAYDGFGTIELNPFIGRDHRGVTLRLVSIRPEHAEWQTGRYASGMHCAVTLEEAAKYPLVFGLEVPHQHP